MVFERATQQSVPIDDKLAQTQRAIREQQNIIEDFQIKIQKHVEKLTALRREEKILLEEQTLFELEKVQRELSEADKKGGKKEEEFAKEMRYEVTMLRQMLGFDALYEAEF